MSVGEGWDLPAEEEPSSDFHWFKVSPKGSLVLVVLSERPLWYTGHFVDGRMWPCQGSGCEMCEHGVGSQVRYVLAVAEVSSHRVGLIEMGRGIGLQIREWMDRRSELRGMVLEWSKHSLSRQSRTEVIFVDRECPPWWRVQNVPDVHRALLLTWRKAEMAIPPSMREVKSEVLP